MNLILVYHLLVSTIAVVFMWLFNATQNILDFSIGALLISFNLVYYGWIFVALMKKKLIALGLSLIVIKYALLAGAIYYLLNSPGRNFLWIAAGVGTLIPTVLVVAFVQTFLKEK